AARLPAARARPAGRGATPRSPRLRQHASARVEVSVGVLLEDAFARLAVERIDLALVAQLERRRIRERGATDRADLGDHDRSSSMSGWCARTSCPLSATMRRTVPLFVDRISLNSFIASMSPMTSPAATKLPISTNAGVCGDGDR